MARGNTFKTLIVLYQYYIFNIKLLLTPQGECREILEKFAQDKERVVKVNVKIVFKLFMADRLVLFTAIYKTGRKFSFAFMTMISKRHHFITSIKIMGCKCAWE